MKGYKGFDKDLKCRDPRGEIGGAVMEKCPKCGAEVSWTDDRPGLSRVGFKCLTFITSMGTAAESVECCKRQLAAANERAGRLEAQMVELREGWPSFEYVDDTEGMVAVEVPEVVIQNFHRILGGA